MGKVCIIYNFAPHYRESIFQLMDREWDCEWFFGENTSDIKGLDLKKLKHASTVPNKYLTGSVYWQKGTGKQIRDKKYDRYILLGEPKILSSWWVLLQRRLLFRNKKVYLWTHGWYGREGFLKKWMKRLYFGMADHVLTYGEYAKGEAAKQGFDATKISPIHNSLDHERQIRLRAELKPTDIYKDHFGNDRPTLIFIGRLTAVKRLDLLLKALAKLKKDGKIYNLVMIGGGQKEAELKKEAENLGLSENVWFYGPCYDERQNAQLLYDADLCVSPGNVGLTSIHSMVFGTPVISHNDFNWQMPEFEAIKPGKTGDFFKFGDTVDLSRAIEEWFTTHPDRDKVRKDCFDEIDTYWTPEYQMQVLRKVLN